MNPIKLFEENKVIAGFSLLNLLFKHGKCSLVKSVMDKLLCLYDQKKIKPVVDSLWALEEVRAWCEHRMEDSEVNGDQIKSDLITVVT